MIAWIITLAVVIAVLVGFYIYVKWDSVSGFIIAGGAIGLGLILLYALSWIVTVGIVKLITLCFGWTFSWGMATGVWLILMIAKWVFGVVVNK